MTMGEKKRWTKDEEVFLVNNYENMKLVDIGIKLNRTKYSISEKARIMNVNKMDNWNNSDIAFVALNYPTIENHEIATAIGRTISSIQNMAQRIGIPKSGIKMSNAKKKSFKDGKTSPCIGAVGKENSQWQGGISFTPYDDSFNNKFKNAIRKRDNQICMLCNIHREKIRQALSIHHINYDKLLSIPQNCLSLCHSCHSKTNSNRKHWQTFFQNLLSEKYNYKYEDKEVIVEINPVGERSGLF